MLLMKGICGHLGTDYAVGCQHEAADGKAHSHDQTEQLGLVTAIWTHSIIVHVCVRSYVCVCVCANACMFMLSAFIIQTACRQIINSYHFI